MIWKKKICVLGRFDLEILKNRVLFEGFKENGIEVEALSSIYAGSRTALSCEYAGYHLKFFLNLVPRIIIENLSLALACLFNVDKIRSADILFLPSFSNYNVLTGKMFAAIFGKKLLLDAHGSLYFQRIMAAEDYPAGSIYARILLSIDKFGALLCDHYMTHSEKYKENLAKIFNINANKFIVCLSGYPEITIRSQKEAGTGLIVAMMSSFKKFHGVENVILAANKINKADKIIFILAGGGPQEKNCKNMISDLGIKNIAMPGMLSQEAATECIRNSDVLLGPFGDSMLNNMDSSNKICEAAAYGKPLIALESDSSRELFKDGESILFCKSNNPAEIAEKIQILYRSPDLREKMGLGIRKVYEKKLTPKTIVKELCLKIFK